MDDYRKVKRSKVWEGKFSDYLQLVREKPHISRLAHARIYHMIEAAGVEKGPDGKRYHFFSEELFGLDRTLSRLVDEYLHPAAMRLDVRKRILLLVGPVSGGKSTLVNLLKRGLERYSRTDEGALYAIKGCPMHEEPLHLIPHDLRADFEKEFRVRVEGDLCPYCRMRVETEFNGNIEEVPVERIFLSEADRIGIGTFSPSDPKSQDIAELTGSIDFSTITEYGTESDPRAYRFDGELNIANRGIMEFQEMLKCDEKFLWHLLSLSQEGNFKAGRFALIYADEMIVAHTNESEYISFISNKKNEALASRMIVLKIPYNLRVSDEIKIYEKLIKQSDLKNVHIAPHALRAAAMFAVLSRLRESKKQGMDIVKKMKLYNGEDVEGFCQKDVRGLRDEHPDEGMDGVDPRYVVNRLSAALVQAESQCITALDVLRALRDGLDQHSSITKDTKERYLNYLDIARREFDEITKKEVQKVLIYSYEESAKTLFDNYLDNVEAFCNGHRVKDPITGQELEPDERLMRAIEEQVGVSENAKASFREEILIRLSAYARQGKRFDYKCHERLREAIERKLFADLRDVLKLTTSARIPDDLQLKNIREVTARLVKDYGYCPVCATELLRYVGSLLSR
ncbi:MAG: PrkA family serine protein kinase [Peptococcaceae bacterium]|nr:PrkA family serine protein kinase [Peptococcaceae bacterium]